MPTSASLPSVARTARASSSTLETSLSTGGTLRVYVTVAATPYGARIPCTSSSTRAGASSQAELSRQRTVPSSSPACGMALATRPAAIRPQTTLSDARGSTRRDRAPGMPITSWPMA